MHCVPQHVITEPGLQSSFNSFYRFSEAKPAIYPPAVRPTQHKECVMVTGMFTAVADFQRHSNTAWLRLASYVRALVGVLDVGHMQSLESRLINAMPTPVRGCC